MPPHELPMNVAAPAWKFFIPMALLAAGLAWGATAYSPWLTWGALAAGILAFYVLLFFRDPRRTPPNIPGGVISPADGKVVSIIEVPCEQMPGGRARRVAIFLNIFNVHIQRASYPGRVTQIIRKPGKFINALNEKCSEENEQVTLWLESDDTPFGIRQIAGAIARRIVVYVKEGDMLSRGERYGLIQFGSRVELFLPLDATIKVQPGQKVRGGETVMALLHEEDVKKGRAISRSSNPMNKLPESV